MTTFRCHQFIRRFLRRTCSQGSTNFEVRHPRCVGSITKNIVYYTYSRTQLYFTQQYSRNTTTCFGSICWPSSGCDSTYRAATQDVWGVVLNFSICHLLFYCTSYRLNMFRALLRPSSGAVYYNNKEYCVLHIQSNTTIFHPAVQ